MSKMVHSLLWFVAVLSFITPSWAAVVMRGPVDASRMPGDWAEFTCTVACSHSIDWYVEGYLGDITDTCSDTNNGMMVCKLVTEACSSPTSTFGYTETLRVLAKPELASSSIAVQCAAVSRSAPSRDNCPPFLAYSRYALLDVGSLPTTEPPTTLPPPTTAPTTPPPPVPSPSPVVCPSTTQNVEVRTVTETVTSTQVVTEIVKVTVTPEPGVINRGASPRTHMSKVLSELLSWGVTVLAGLLVL